MFRSSQKRKSLNLQIEPLKAAIEEAYGCKASWVEFVCVTERFERETAWDGIVHVFNVLHADAKAPFLRIPDNRQRSAVGLC